MLSFRFAKVYTPFVLPDSQRPSPRLNNELVVPSLQIDKLTTPSDPAASTDPPTASMIFVPDHRIASSKFHNGYGRGFGVPRNISGKRMWLENNDPALTDWLG